MKIPRDCNGDELVRALRRLGYETQRQSGSHNPIVTGVKIVLRLFISSAVKSLRELELCSEVWGELERFVGLRRADG